MTPQPYTINSIRTPEGQKAFLEDVTSGKLTQEDIDRLHAETFEELVGDYEELANKYLTLSTRYIRLLKSLRLSIIFGAIAIAIALYL
jgi:hypothetical protein